MHFADLILILIFAGAGCAVSYLLLLRKIRQVVTERELKIADQLAALDDAIRALETRLSEHHAASEMIEAAVMGRRSAGVTREARKSQRQSHPTFKR